MDDNYSIIIAADPYRHSLSAERDSLIPVRVGAV